MNRQKRLIAMSALILMMPLSGCVTTAVVGTAAVGSATFDKRPVGRHLDDVSIATNIEAKLAGEKDMPSRWVSVEVIEGTATLTGYLPSQSHIDRAIGITRTVEGVVDVHSELHIGEPETGELFSDTFITTKVKTKLLDDPMVSGFAIKVETVSGKVYLQGIVGSEEERYRASDLAASVSGVVAVVNRLRIKTR